MKADPLDPSIHGPSSSSARGVHVILFDGVCGLCHRLVRFVIRHDADGRFSFASLQSRFSKELFGKRDREGWRLDTVVVVAHYGSDAERLFCKSAAALFIMRELGGIWRWIGIVRLLPLPLLDAVYDFVAKHRYRLFGKYDSCALPDKERRARFIEV